MIEEIRLSEDEKKELREIEKDIESVRKEIAKARRIGIDVTELLRMLRELERTYKALLEEY